MADVGTLAVKLVAQTNRFKADMAGAVRPVQVFANSVRSMRAGLANIAGPISAIGGTAIAAGIALVGREMSKIDSTGELAQRLGSTTEQIIALRRASEMAGPGAEAMNAALEKLNRTMGDAMAGGASKSAFGALGMDIQKLVDMGPAQAFTVIGDALNRVSDQSTKAALAAQFFGRSGMQLLGVLSMGASGANEMAAASQKAGTSFNDLQGAQVGNAVDALTGLKEILTGIATQLSVQLAPFIEATAQKLIDMGTQGIGIAGRIEKAFENVGAVFYDLRNAVNGIKIVFLALKALVTTVVFVIAKAFEVLVKGVTLAVEGIIRAANLIPGIDIPLPDTNVVDAFTSELSKSVEDSMVSAHKSMLNTFKGALDSAASPQAADKSVKDIQKKSKEKAAASLAKPKSGPPIDTAGNMAAQAQEESMQKRAESLKASVQSPQEVFDAAKKEADALLKAGKIDQQTYARLGAKAREDLTGNAKGQDAEAEAESERGQKKDSGEFMQTDLSRLASGGAGGSPGDAQTRLVDINSRQLEALKAIRQSLRGPQYGLLA